MVETIESGFMTKDLALLVGDQQAWLSTEGFLDKVDGESAEGAGLGERLLAEGGVRSAFAFGYSFSFKCKSSSSVDCTRKASTIFGIE